MKLKNIIITMLLASAGSTPGWADRLVILHTNDTHSQIDPNDSNRGGILRRKVLIDSIRELTPHVVLVDAGDAVQGTLYFSLFGGEVEQKLMNALGYDIQILGNHEFDNGMVALAEQYAKSEAVKLTTNYDLRGTELDTLFRPYTIKEIGDKKVGFIGINLRPEGMVAEGKYDGVKYLDGLKAANATAWHLKHNERVDMVVALTHVGYRRQPDYSDLDLAAGSENIDVIIGGHSHTLIDASRPDAPAHRVPNAAGDTVVIAQLGKGGVHLGEIDIDLDTRKITTKVIPVDQRLDSRIDPAAAALLKPYRHSVDSIRAIKIGRATQDFRTSEPGLLNLISDFIADKGQTLIDEPLDMAIMNKGGIRCDMPKGDITKGLVMMMMPFDNRVYILEIKGSDLLEAFDVMATRYGDGVSRGVEIAFDPETSKCISATINGEPIDPERTYRIATIDYLAHGGDYMAPLKRGTVVATSDNVLYDDLITFLVSGPYKKKSKKLAPDNTPRMYPVK